MGEERTVSEVSETELIAAFSPLLPRGDHTLVPTGDDAAVIAAPDGRFVVSTDVLVEDRHFRRAWGTAEDVGWRAAMQNLADIAAMGARPVSMVVGLVLPADLPVDWVLGLARGLAQACAPLGVGVDGGDLSSGESIVVAVTVHGDLGGREPVLRRGARPGDVVAHAGVLGHAAAGLALLTASTGSGWGTEGGAGSGGGTEAGAGERHARLVADFLRPRPPLAGGPAAADAGASAMMDVSDGLLRDAGRLARASGVLLDLDPLETSVPDDLAVLEPVAHDLGLSARDWVLTGGEDHGLLATFPRSAALPPGFRRIGEVRAVGAGEPAVLVGGHAPTTGSLGWDHFSGA
ncbi:thiamine-phosphate kinase [Georgenia wangjunii]|uniref:thiamine-phosphate kinase n=1 Tax=Georgenia wangjunii TaxID=3117730 RepID=UPI003D9C5B49